MGLMPGVEAHAQALEQILSKHFLERPSWARGLESLVLTLCCLLVGLLAMRLRALAAACATLLLLVGLLGGAWWAFVSQRLLLDAATPALGVLLSYMVCSLWQHFSSEREQRWIKSAFSRYVSPNRVAHLVAHPGDMALGGRRQTCSFVFTDLTGFTGLMESIDPALAVSLLNDYLDQMVAIAFRFDGTLDRIVGDKFFRDVPDREALVSEAKGMEDVQGAAVQHKQAGADGLSPVQAKRLLTKMRQATLDEMSGKFGVAQIAKKDISDRQLDVLKAHGGAVAAVSV